MMRPAIFTLFFAILVGSIGAIKPRIVGGENANIANFPYQASIRYKNYHFCGGTIIGEKHILTAAHCISKYQDVFVAPFYDISIVTGTSYSISIGNTLHIAKITLHPEWTGNYELNNDIAIITLTGNIIFDEKQRKVEMPTQDVVSGTKATLTGWGYLSMKSNGPSPQLQKLEMTLLDHNDCEKRIPTKFHKTQLCAYAKRGCGGCISDSGSPVVANNQIVGIFSWVFGESASGVPEVFTNVYAHRDFIHSAMNT